MTRWVVVLVVYYAAWLWASSSGAVSPDTARVLFYWPVVVLPLHLLWLVGREAVGWARERLTR